MSAELADCSEARFINEAELLALGFSKADLLANWINGLLGFSVYEKAKRENLADGKPCRACRVICTSWVS